MFGAMLVGAWLLVHQQCCVTGEADSRNRYSLYDPLTRRSALEKNFMRFGRSLWTSADDFNQSETMAKFSFLRFGKSKTDSFTESDAYGDGEEYIGPRAPKTDVNHVRSGAESDQRFDGLKSDFDGFSRLAKAKGNFIRFGRNGNNFLRFGRSQNNFIRLGRNTENFIRFGRKPDVVLGSGMDERPNRSDSERKREKQDFRRIVKNDNFMRFGRHKFSGGGDLGERRNGHEAGGKRPKSTDEDIQLQNRARSFVRQKELDRGSGFIRFGRAGKVERARLDDEIQFASIDCKQKQYRLSRMESGDFQLRKTVSKVPRFKSFLPNPMDPTIVSLPAGLDSMEVMTLKNFFHFYSSLLTKLNALE